MIDISCWEFCLQALKSGQLPADFKSLDENVTSNNVEEDKTKDEGESNDTEEQRNAESAPMEQVSIYYLSFLLT